MKIGNYVKYTKAIVGLIGTVATVLQTIWPHAQWSAAVTSLITAVLVYLVPNQTAAAASAENQVTR